MKKIMLAGLLGLLAGCATQAPQPQVAIVPTPRVAPAPTAVVVQPAPVSGPQSYVITARKFDLATDEVVTELRHIGYQAYNEKKSVHVSATTEDFNFIRKYIQEVSRSIPVVRDGSSQDARIVLE